MGQKSGWQEEDSWCSPGIQMSHRAKLNGPLGMRTPYRHLVGATRVGVVPPTQSQNLRLGLVWVGVGHWVGEPQLELCTA